MAQDPNSDPTAYSNDMAAYNLALTMLQEFSDPVFAQRATDWWLKAQRIAERWGFPFTIPQPVGN